MTRGRGIMVTFRQNEHFSKVLIVWRVRAKALVVLEAIWRKCGSLGG
jgi:hypothetical protein